MSFLESSAAKPFTLTLAQGIKLACRKYSPEVSRNISVIYCHGMQSHQAWFVDTALALTKLGITVYTLDRPGSGRSDSEDGIPAHVSSYQLFLDALRLMIFHANRDSPKHALYVWGNSYGGKVVAAIADDSTLPISGLIFTTPGICVNKSKIKRRFSLLSFLLASHKAYFPSFIPEDQGDRAAGLFTGDEHYAAFIREDSLSLREFTKQYFLETIKLDRHVSKHAKNIQTPTLLLLLDHDAMMDNRKTEQFFQKNFKHLKSKTFENPSGLGHYLMFSDAKEAALQEINRFVGKSS